MASSHTRHWLPLGEESLEHRSQHTLQILSFSMLAKTKRRLGSKL